MAVKKKPERKTTSAKKKKGTAKTGEKQLRVKLVRSVVGRPKKQREVVKGLGLRRVDSEVICKDCPEIRGMINTIPHLVKVEVLDKK